MNRESVSTPLALRPREAAKALGISPRLLWQLTKDGHVPCVRVGNGKRQSVLYPVAELQAWLSRESKGSQAEPLGHVSENGNHNGLQLIGKGE
ncbi:MAG: helix-turn-helix transcriptional regulator [Gemmataceae bacterium]